MSFGAQWSTPISAQNSTLLDFARYHRAREVSCPTNSAVSDEGEQGQFNRELIDCKAFMALETGFTYGFRPAQVACATIARLTTNNLTFPLPPLSAYLRPAPEGCHE
jgi:hypothetical protein